MSVPDGLVDVFARIGHTPYEIEEKRAARQRVIERVVAVLALDSERLDQGREIVVRETGDELPRQRDRVAEREFVRIGHVLELAALVLEHPEIEVDVVCDEERIASEKLEEPVERLARRNAVFIEERHRDVMDRLGLRVDHAGRNDVEVERALQLPAHILCRGELDDLVIADDAGRLGVEHDHASAGRMDPVVGKSLVCDPAGHGWSFGFLDEFRQYAAEAGLLGLIARLDRMGEKPLRLDDLLIDAAALFKIHRVLPCCVHSVRQRRTRQQPRLRAVLSRAPSAAPSGDLWT